MSRSTHEGRIAAQGVPLRLLMLLLLTSLVAAPARAELTCNGFHALLGFAIQNHYKSFTADEYNAFYAVGLRVALEVLQGQKRLVSLEQWSELTTPPNDQAEYNNCNDSERMSRLLIGMGIPEATPAVVRAMQLKGVLASMDPHSDYQFADEWRLSMRLAESAKLGARLTGGDKHPVVQHVYPEGPADGILETGDELLRVERPESGTSENFEGLEPQRVMLALAGEVDETLRLVLRRGGAIKHVELTLAPYSGSRVATATVEDRGVGYMQLSDFGFGAAADFSAALQHVQQGGARSLILDLRNNPGGSVNEAVEILDQLLDTGIGVVFQGRDGILSHERFTKAGMQTDMPVAVLLNRMSASAAELLPGTLRDYERALLVGETTYGKGNAQLVYPPEALQTIDPSIDGSLRLTVWQYFSPTGNSPQRRGLAAHVVVADAELEKLLAPKRRDYRRKGYPWIEYEKDYPNALPERYIDSQLASSEVPTNSMRTILNRLLSLVQTPVGKILPQPSAHVTATSLLLDYQRLCISYHQEQCDEPTSATLAMQFKTQGSAN